MKTTEVKKQLKILIWIFKVESMTAFVGHSGAGKSTIMNLAYQDFMTLKKEIFKLMDQDIQKEFQLSSLKKKYFT